MSDPPKPFSIDLASLKTRQKDISDASVERADSAGENRDNGMVTNVFE